MTRRSLIFVFELQLLNVFKTEKGEEGTGKILLIEEQKSNPMYNCLVCMLCIIFCSMLMVITCLHLKLCRQRTPSRRVQGWKLEATL